MRGDPGSDGYGTFYDHPANSRPLGQTGPLEESSLRTNLHGHAVKVAPSVRSPEPFAHVASYGLMARGLAFVAGADELPRILVEAHFAAGGAEVVGLAVVEGAVLGSGCLDRHLAYRINCSCLACHVISLTRSGMLADRRSVIRSDLDRGVSR